MNWSNVVAVLPAFGLYAFLFLAVCAVVALWIWLEDRGLARLSAELTAGARADRARTGHVFDEPYGWDMPFSVEDDRP